MVWGTLTGFDVRKMFPPNQACFFSDMNVSHKPEKCTSFPMLTKNDYLPTLHFEIISKIDREPCRQIVPSVKVPTSQVDESRKTKRSTISKSKNIKRFYIILGSLDTRILRWMINNVGNVAQAQESRHLKYSGAYGGWSVLKRHVHLWQCLVGLWHAKIIQSVFSVEGRGTVRLEGWSGRSRHFSVQIYKHTPRACLVDAWSTSARRLPSQ